jgi:hypothetical protein
MEVSRVVLLGIYLVVAQDARLSDLTVPADRLPTGCALSPTPSVKLDGNTYRGGLWAGLPSNPWTGTDAMRIASIAGVFTPPARMPDGPPLDGKDAALFRLRLAEGIDEGYEAVYLPSDSNMLLIVYGLRFPAVASAQSFFRQSRFAQDQRAVQTSSIVALVSGPEGECLDSVLAHIRALVR